jgi:hypothetical protein
MKLFKTSPSKFAALFVSVAVLGLASQSASALTASGTVVNNTASLTYVVGGTTQTPIASSPTGNTVAGTAGTPTAFTVDKKVDFTVVGGLTTNVQPLQAGVTGQAQTAANPNTVLTYTVTNNGNDAQGFILTAANATPVAATDVFDPTAIKVFVETDGVAGYSAGDTATGIATLAPGATVTVYVLSTIPATSITATPLVNGNQAQVTLTAQAAATGTVTAPSLIAGTPGTALVASNAAAGSNATGGANVNLVDVVFAEAANVLTGTIAAPVDAAFNGKSSANDTYNIQSAVLTVTKMSSVVCDPVTGTVAPNNIPGAAIQYAITIANASTAGGPANLATATALSDTLAATVTFDPNKVQGAAVAPFCTGTTAFASANGVGYTLAAAAPVAGAAPVSVAPAGAHTLVGGVLNVDFATILPTTLAPATGAGTRAVAGDLNAGEFITIYFNVFVN